MKKSKPLKNREYVGTRELVVIEAIDYSDGLTLYNLQWKDEDGNTTSSGMYDEVEVMGQLLYLMQVIKEEPRFLVRNTCRYDHKK